MADVKVEMTQTQDQASNSALRQLDKLVGTWKLQGRNFGDGGAISGQMTFEWMEGGCFLMQHVDIDHAGHRVKGIEIIGYGRSWDGTTSPDCSSYFFSTDGELFTYIYDVDDDALTIWGGERGSPARYKGTFSTDHNTITGAWEWPGGGYEAVSTRVA